MKVYYCNDHDGHWPVGVVSVIIAGNRRSAKRLLDEQLIRDGLKPFAEKPYTLHEIKTNQPQAIIICNGSY